MADGKSIYLDNLKIHLLAVAASLCVILTLSWMKLLPFTISDSPSEFAVAYAPALLVPPLTKVWHRVIAMMAAFFLCYAAVSSFLLEVGSGFIDAVFMFGAFAALHPSTLTLYAAYWVTSVLLARFIRREERSPK